MKVKDIITIDRASNAGSTGYLVSLVKLEKLALLEESYTPPAPGHPGAPGMKHFTFQAIAAGKAEIQFAKYRPWLLPQEVLYEEVLPIDIEPADEAGAVEMAGVTDAAALVGAIQGGWTGFTKVSADARKVFDEAVKGLIGFHYTPMAVTTQTVSGTNYIFAGNARVINGSDYPILIRIFKPLNGASARVCETCALGLPGAPGAFGPFRETNDSDRTTLKTSLRGFTGANFEPLLTSTQVVSQGVTLMFAGTQTLLDASGDKFPAIFKAYSPFGSNPIFTGSQKAYELV